MRKALLLFAVVAPVSALAGLVVPAIAASVGGASISQPAATTLDLEKIPVKPVAGRLSVKGLAIDDESDDDGHDLRKAPGSRTHSGTHAEDDDGPSGSHDADD